MTVPRARWARGEVFGVYFFGHWLNLYESTDGYTQFDLIGSCQKERPILIYYYGQTVENYKLFADFFYMFSLSLLHSTNY